MFIFVAKSASNFDNVIDMLNGKYLTMSMTAYIVVGTMSRNLGAVPHEWPEILATCIFYMTLEFDLA